MENLSAVDLGTLFTCFEIEEQKYSTMQINLEPKPDVTKSCWEEIMMRLNK